MKVKLCIIDATSAEGNKRPLGGDATFDDGKTYGWNIYAGEMRFSGYRKLHGRWESFSFSSLAREKAVLDALDGNDRDAVVMTGMEHSELVYQQEQERSAQRRKEREEHDAKVMREGGTLSNGQEIYTLEERAQLREELRRQNAEARAALDRSGRRGLHPGVAAIRADLAANQNREEKTMPIAKSVTVDQTKHYKEKAAIAEGWVISSSGNGFELQKLDDHAEWPGFDPKKGRIFETDQEVCEHVVARAWAGSEDHRKALDFLNRAAPEEYARTGDEALKTASVLYRMAEGERFAQNRDRLWAEIETTPGLKDSLQVAFRDLDEDLARKHAERPNLKNYEAHHTNQVAREAFLLGYMDTGTPEGALEAARRRMLITATPHEFYKDALAEPEKETEADAPAP